MIMKISVFEPVLFNYPLIRSNHAGNPLKLTSQIHSCANTSPDPSKLWNAKKTPSRTPFQTQRYIQSSYNHYEVLTWSSKQVCAAPETRRGTRAKVAVQISQRMVTTPRSKVAAAIGGGGALQNENLVFILSHLILTKRLVIPQQTHKKNNNQERTPTKLRNLELSIWLNLGAWGTWVLK